MKIYYAAVNHYVDYFIREDVKRVLFSFWDLSKRPQLLDKIKGHSFDLFLDCGAYSAWTHGKTIDIDEYAKFILTHRSLINVYPNLDVKGSVEKTLKNQKILEEKYKLNPIPVFHVNTQRWDILEDYIKHYDYIALGAIAGEKLGDAFLTKALDNVFSRIRRNPTTKFHGFGFTVQRFLKKYPFYSADSTSWLSGTQYGVLTRASLIDKMHMHNRVEAETITRGIKVYQQIEKEITDLWNIKGVAWK